jgi:iron(II)-dependent oxidoreductase
MRLDGALTEDALMASLASSAVLAEVHDTLETLRPDVICWADATWGLGFDAVRHATARSVLMVHVMRDDPLIRKALELGPDRVIVPSSFVLNQAASSFDTSGWRVVPNGLLPGPDDEQFGQFSSNPSRPIRLIARLEPQKGVEEFLAASPPVLTRTIDVVLAAAGFEYYAGMQQSVETRVRAVIRDRAAVHVCPPLAWHEVRPFLSQASVCVIPSVEPETFGLVALEAMSVGTPVCAFDLGHLPELVGEAGRLVPLDAGPAGLWAGADELLKDEAEHAYRSQAGLRRSQPYAAERVARQFLEAVLR